MRAHWHAPPRPIRRGIYLENPTQQAIRLATLRALKARIAELEAEITAEFSHALEEGDAKAATLPDGTRLGKVSKSRGRETPAVVDEQAFLIWVTANYPTEIVSTVRPAFRDKMLASAKVHGVAVDDRTGEVVPGVELRTGNPYISFRGERGYQEIVAAHWAELVGPALLDGGAT